LVNPSSESLVRLTSVRADAKPRQTTGKGVNRFGGGWDVVAPSGKKIESD